MKHPQPATHNYQSDHGTRLVPYQARIVKDLGEWLNFQHLGFQSEYCKYQPEELRLVDYAEDKKFGRKPSSSTSLSTALQSFHTASSSQASRPYITPPTSPGTTTSQVGRGDDVGSRSAFAKGDPGRRTRSSAKSSPPKSQPHAMEKTKISHEITYNESEAVNAWTALLKQRFKMIRRVEPCQEENPPENAVEHDLTPHNQAEHSAAAHNVKEDQPVEEETAQSDKDELAGQPSDIVVTETQQLGEPKGSLQRCWAECEELFESNSAILHHIETGACKAGQISTVDLNKTAASMDRFFLFIHGRFLIDLEDGIDMEKEYKGNAYPFLCPKCSHASKTLSGLFRHVERNACGVQGYPSYAVMPDLLEALQYRCGHGLL